MVLLKYGTVEAEPPPTPGSAVAVIREHLSAKPMGILEVGDNHILWRRLVQAGWLYIELVPARRIVNVWCVETVTHRMGKGGIGGDEVTYQRRVRYETIDLEYHNDPVKVVEYHAARVSRGDD